MTFHGNHRNMQLGQWNCKLLKRRHFWHVLWEKIINIYKRVNYSILLAWNIMWKLEMSNICTQTMDFYENTWHYEKPTGLLNTLSINVNTRWFPTVLFMRNFLVCREQRWGNKLYYTQTITNIMLKNTKKSLSLVQAPFMLTASTEHSKDSCHQQMTGEKITK